MRSVWITVLFVLGALGLAGGFYIFSNAQSAVHEIEALICFLIGVCGTGFAVMCASIERVVDRLAAKKDG